MYQKFAEIYDELMEEAPYERWLDYILDKYETYMPSKSDPSLVLDLGCGTGTLTAMLAQEGLDMIGLDLSEGMLNIAREKWEDQKGSGKDILFLQQDMRDMALFGSVDLIVSMCDSLNYMTEEGDFRQVLDRCYYHMNPGALMIFDLNTAYKFREEIGDETYAENFSDYSYIWENYFDEETGIHEYGVTMFVSSGHTYDKYQEFHYEKVYEPALVKEMIKASGFDLLELVGDMGQSDLDQASKHYYILRKPEEQ